MALWGNNDSKNTKGTDGGVGCFAASGVYLLAVGHIIVQITQGRSR